MEWVAKMGVDIIRLPDRFIAHHSPVSTIIQSMSVSYIMNLDTLWVPFNSIIQFRYVVLAIVFIESPAFKSLIFSLFWKYTDRHAHHHHRTKTGETHSRRRNGKTDSSNGYSLLFSPQTHNWSRTAIRDLPLSLRLYSTFGGICGYSFLMISRSVSSSFRLLLSVLSDTFFRYRLNSLNLTTSNSIRQ